MRFAAIASALVVALAAAGVAGAGQTPKRAPVTKITVTGKISVLELKTITVHGKITVHGRGNLTCRVTTTSPALRGLTIGARAKIVCRRGVLLTIKRLPVTSTLTTPVLTIPAPGTGGVVEDGTITVTPDKTSPVAPATIKPSLSVVGTATITALGGGSITFGGSITCTVKSTSPSTAAFRVGQSVDYQCASGVLSKISVGID